MKILVTIKSVYGIDKVYPACEKATTLCYLLKKTTLTDRDITRIKQLGFEIEVQQNTIKI
jgi:hypothetical protein